MSNNLEDKESEKNSEKLYSFNEGQKKPNNFESEAIRRSIGDIDVNINNSKKIEEIDMNVPNIRPELAHQTSIVHIDQSPPYIWVLFLVFGIIQVVFILIFFFYYFWDEELNHPNLIKYKPNEKAKKDIKDKYRSFQDMIVMIFLGFGFIRASLKHHLWSSIILTFISGVLAFEFGLICIILWSSLLKRDWLDGKYNFNFFFDAGYLAACFIISLGSFIGKLSFSQYFVVIIIHIIFSSLNYLVVRQSLKVIDIGGTLTVHLYGAVFGFAFSFISFCNDNEKERIRTSLHIGSDHNSNLFALFGSLMIIPLWPSFNTALISGNQKYRGIINTYFSVGGSIITYFLMSAALNNKKFKIEDIIYASFPGAIIIGGCCHLIKEFYLCILFGIIASVACSLFNWLFYEKIKIKEKGYHDTVQVLFYHGIPAIIGGILSSVFMGNLKNLDIFNFNYKMFIGTVPFEDIENTNTNVQGKAAVLFSAIFITIIIAGASGFCVGLSVRFCNCNIALRYFNDSEFFDVKDNEPFPWIDEEVEIKFNYNSKSK